MVIPAGMGEDRESSITPNFGRHRDRIVARIVVCDPQTEDMDIIAASEFKSRDHDK